MSSSAGRSARSSVSDLSKRPIDPITRTALRYTISPREYELLHQYLISRAPQRVQKQAPNPPRYETFTKSTSESGEYHAAALRAALRTFVGLYLALKGFETAMQKLASRKAGAPPQASPSPPPGTAAVTRHRNARIALSYAGLLFFHRLLHRFFRRLRASLLEDSAAPFRRRNPGVTRALASTYTPAVGAALAGLTLAASPADQLRLTVAIYLFSRGLEFGFNALADADCLWWKKDEGRPWWFGSWLIMPVACGQLLHAFVFDRDCFPESFGRFILARSPEYIQLRPHDYPSVSSSSTSGGSGDSPKPWPGTFDIVDALAALSKLRWPAFVSPILFPNSSDKTAGSLPAVIQKMSPITAPAHPAIAHTSCAVLHPHDPSCARTYLKFWLAAFPAVAKFFALFYAAFALLAYKAALRHPVPFLNRLSARVLRMSLFVTGAIGTSWASICLFAALLPRRVLPTQRWFFGGFLGGLWAFVARHQERSNFLYSFRLSVDSLYKVGRKRGWWKGLRGGDVGLFVASLALVNVVYEANPAAVQGASIRKALGMLNGEGWVDRAAATSPLAAEVKAGELPTVPPSDEEGEAKEKKEN